MDYLIRVERMGRGRSKVGGSGGAGGKPSADELSALEGYVSGEFMWINDYFRDPSGFGDLSEDEKSFVKDLDKMTGRDNVGGQTLFRSVDASAVFGNMNDGDYEDLVAHLVYGDNQRLIADNARRLIDRTNGKNITEKGYMSTTQDRNVAENWGDFSGSSRPIVMEIHTGKNVRGAVVNRHASEYMKMAEQDSPQKEVLLGRNKQIKVRNIKAANGNIVVVADVN